MILAAIWLLGTRLRDRRPEDPLVTEMRRTVRFAKLALIYITTGPVIGAATLLAGCAAGALACAIPWAQAFTAVQEAATMQPAGIPTGLLLTMACLDGPISAMFGMAKRSSALGGPARRRIRTTSIATGTAVAGYGAALAATVAATTWLGAAREPAVTAIAAAVLIADIETCRWAIPWWRHDDDDEPGGGITRPTRRFIETTYQALRRAAATPSPARRKETNVT